MPRKKQTKQDKQLKFMFCTGIAIFIIITACFNFICYQIYGVNIQFIPIHDSPRGCEEEGYQACTTAFGTCTKDKQKCVSPKDQEKCKYIAFQIVWDEKKYFDTHPKVKRSKLSYKKLEKTRQIYEKYCGAPSLGLRDSLSSILSNWIVFFLEIMLTAAIYTLFYPQILKGSKLWAN